MTTIIRVKPMKEHFKLAHSQYSINPYDEMLQVLSGIIPISKEERGLVKTQFKFRVFPKNSILLSTEDYWVTMFFINHGIIRIYYMSEDGRDFNKGFFFEGMFLWPIAPSARNYPSRFIIETMEQCETLICDLRGFRKTLQMLGYWDKFSLFHAEWLADDKAIREADFLLLSAQERYLKFVESYKEIADRIPDYHIASYLGITNVALSRIKKNLFF